MAQSNFDVLVIGGGPGGYVAALRAAQLKLRTALVEREHLGGICLNWGCIPTKSLLHTADTLRRIRHAGDLGLGVAEPTIDFPRVMARSRDVAQRLNRGVSQLLRKAGVTVLDGHASLAPECSVRVRAADGSVQTLQARHTIVATGAHARALPMLPFDGDRVWSYRDALATRERPASLLVIGAGAIGMEFASFYATLGTQVTVVEAQARVLPAGDADVSAFVAKAVERDGIRLRTRARLDSAQVGPEGVQVVLLTAAGRETLQAERVLVAVGLAGNTDGLGLEHTQVKAERGLILADAWGRTADPDVHAIGDVTGAPMLAHRASHQGLACVDRLAGLQGHAASPLIPSCVYSHPQSASVGLTEEEARSLGRPLRVGRFPLEASGKAIAIGEASGFVKTLFDADTGALLGAHIVGPDAPELIHGFTLAGTLEATEAELMETVYPHPTLSEALHESVLAAFGRPLHI
ncbi:MAG: dihydrolipoyl dehydrogenase [Hydrogenophaga sp.]|uniref:dihydrolipoyl dehydrogenase n=1 Tax=Hydrogenophaga sp. TaxID=1904254 RepID=UPI00261F0B13|nr:dihydrolipoyl dehydrogenase [Hydrogenophaga sp.]MCW5672375.1 dihydrolipoyl dehydrogenase [Hydrogenophaga sp.]